MNLHRILAALVLFFSFGPACADYLSDRQKAVSLFLQKDFKGAKPLFESLSKRYTKDSDIWIGLATGYFSSGQYSKAIEAYKKGIGLGARGAQPNFIAQIGRSYAKLGKKDEAFFWLNRAIEEGFEERKQFIEDRFLGDLKSDPRFEAIAGLPTKKLSSRTAKWRYDIGYLQNEIVRLHPNPYWKREKKEFFKEFSKLRAEVAQLSDVQIKVRLQRLIAQFLDGHSGVFSGNKDFKKKLPLRFYLFSEGLFVTDANTEHEGLIGAKVLTFEGKKTKNLFEAVSKYVSKDNVQWPREIVPYLLRQTEFLNAAGIARTDRGVKLQLLTPEGRELEKEIEASEFEFFPEGDFRWGNLYPADPSVRKKHPEYIRSRHRHYWLKEIGETLYFQFNRVREENIEPVREFAKRLESELKGKERLIVDLRHNTGGNSSLLPPLHRVICGFQGAGSKNKIVVLVSRRTFSAAQNFATDLDRDTDAVFVGEATGSKPNFYGETSWVVLPHFKTEFSITSRYHQRGGPSDRRPWISPDLPVEFSEKDYFGFRDPLLAALGL